MKFLTNFMNFIFKNDKTYPYPFSPVHHPKTNDLVQMITHVIGITGMRFEAGLKIHRLAIFSTVCFAITYMLQIVALVDARDDIYRLFECFSVILFTGIGILKMASLHFNHSKWKHLLNIMSQLKEEELKNENLTEYESDEEGKSLPFTGHIFLYTARFRKVSTFLSRMYFLTCVVYVLTPFAEYTLLDATEVMGWPHILPGWAPLEKLGYIGYLVTIFMELVAAIYCVWIHIAFDLTAVGVMIFICGQFSMIREFSQNIGGKGKKWQLSNRRNERAHLRIIRCHKIHVVLMKLTTELNKLLTNFLGVYLFMSTLTLCSVAVRLKTELSKMQLVSLLQYIAATLTQLFLFCYYGDNVFHESSVKMGEGPFGAAYWCLSPRLRRELAILGMGMLIPHRLNAGPFITLDLPCFIQVFTQALSMLLGLPRFCKASGIFAQARLDDFYAIMRKRSDSMLRRLRCSTNSILAT